MCFSPWLGTGYFVYNHDSSSLGPGQECKVEIWLDRYISVTFVAWLTRSV